MLLRAALEAAGQLSAAEWEQLQADARAEVAAGVDFAEAGTPEPVEDLTRFVYSERGGDEDARTETATRPGATTARRHAGKATGTP
jgi:TPP-dependent pyruvate/acetoin dehydrogenase alpha subunit